MTPTPASNLSDAAIFRYVQRTAGIEGLTFAEFLEHGKRTANIVSGMPYSFKYKGRAITHETDVRYIVEGLEVEMAPGRMLLTLADGHLQIESEAQFKSHYMPVLLAPVALDRARATAEPVAWRCVNWSGSNDAYIYRDVDEPCLNAKGENVGEPLYLGATVAPSTNERGTLGSILYIAESDKHTVNDWNYVAQICRAALAVGTEIPQKQSEPTVERKCLTPGAIYSIDTKTWSPCIDFSVTLLSQQQKRLVTEDLSKALEQAFHDAIEPILATIWTKNQPQKHPDHQVESTGTPTGVANEGRGSSE